MKNLINKSFLFILFIFSILLPREAIYNAISLNSSISFGYDSNPLRLSNNEIDELIYSPYLLGDASNIHSRFIQYNLGFKFSSRKGLLSKIFNDKKTIFDFILSDKTHFENKKKSSFNVSFKIDQQLGNYRHIYFNYFIMPDYYLREYQDGDLIIDFSDIEDNLSSVRFNIEKISLAYQQPIKRKVSKLKVGLLYERQLFDKYFTEFDLNIRGVFSQVNFNVGGDKNRLMFYYSYQDADNFRYQDGNQSTSDMDRSYIQKRIKFSITKVLNSNESSGFVVDSYYRNNSSTIFSDELHYMRNHNDITSTLWYKFGKHKIKFSCRDRKTSSPEEWVSELKTFKRYILTYTFTLDKIKL